MTDNYNPNNLMKDFIQNNDTLDWEFLVVFFLLAFNNEDMEQTIQTALAKLPEDAKNRIVKAAKIAKQKADGRDFPFPISLFDQDILDALKSVKEGEDAST